MSKIINLGTGEQVPTKTGRLIINYNVDDKPMWEIEGGISHADAVFMLEMVILQILQEGL